MANLADDWGAQRQMCIDVLCSYLRDAGKEPDPDDPFEQESKGAWQSDREVRHTILREIAGHHATTARGRATTSISPASRSIFHSISRKHVLWAEASSTSHQQRSLGVLSRLATHGSAVVSICLAAQPTGGQLRVQRSEAKNVAWTPTSELDQLRIHPAQSIRINHGLAWRPRDSAHID